MVGYEGEGKHGNNSALIGAVGEGRRGFRAHACKWRNLGRMDNTGLGKG
jgi:hypothetical protein